MSERCDKCGRLISNPSFYDPCQMDHDRLPDKSDRLVEEIENEINSRKGIDWYNLSYDIIDEIRSSLIEVVKKYVKD